MKKNVKRTPKLKEKLPKNLLLILALITAFNIAVLLIRNFILKDNSYNLLIWNLFLGFTPFLIALLLYLYCKRSINFYFISGSFLWLLFYPNAPYMISDLIHIDEKSDMVIYNSMIIFSFTMLSLFFGFYSMKMMYLLYKETVSILIANILVGLSILLSSLGIYLGRILRFNSWDFFTSPLIVINAIIKHLFPVSANPITYIIIFLFSSIQFILLIMIRDTNEMEHNHVISGLPKE